MSGSGHQLAHGARNAKHPSRKQPKQDAETSRVAIIERETEPGLTQDSAVENIGGGPWQTHVGADNVTLILTGELTITHAAALQNELLQAVAQGLEIRLDLAHAVYLDAAILQLICATRRTAVAMGIQFALQHVQPCVIESARVFGMGSVLSDSTSAGDR